LAAAVALLLATSAVPVFADTTSSAESPAEEASVPLPKAEDISEALEGVEQEEEEREEELATPAAAQEREASASAYANADGPEAEELLKEQFAEELAALNSDPARFLTDAKLDEPLGESGAKVTDGEGKTQLLESSVPVRAENEAGEVRKVDLSLQSAGESFAPANPLVDLTIGKAAADGITIGDSGLTITQAGVGEGVAGSIFGDKNVFFQEAAKDTDLMVSPVASGVELFDQLRSAESPETLRFHLDLPPGSELRPDGYGGAEVVKGEATLAEIPLPTAVDAQGTQVPVELEVEGDAIVLNVPQGEGQFADPILVDPEVKTDTFSWSSGNDLEALEEWREIWRWESNDESQFRHSTSCIFSCFSGTQRGLYATSISGTFPANAFGQWYYVAPGSTTYIPSIYPTPSATVNPFNRDNHGCSWESYRQPHDYDALWTGSSWSWLETDRAQWYGNASIYAKGKVLVLGLSTAGSAISIPCWRDIRAGGVSVWLEDPEAPHLNSVEGVPSGWLKKDSTPHTLAVSATDEGLGVQYVRMYGIGSSEWRWNQPSCTGLWNGRCAETRSGQITFETGGFPAEGKVPFTVQAIDPTGKGYNPQEFSLLVDGAPPTINLTGQLATATKEEGEKEKPQSEGNDELSLPTYKLTVEAKDGSPTELRSGVKEIKLFLDGSPTPLATQSQSCPAGSCPMTMSYTLKLPGLSEGTHTLKVVAVDQAGNETKPERKIEFQYIPATGMKEEYVLQHFPLPDGHDYSEELQSHGPELAVNVMNGNVVYHERDMNASTARADLELERIYNSQLPAEKDAQWGHGWSLAQTPEFKPEAGPAPQKATMVRTGAVTSAVKIPESEAQQTFSQKLHATVSKATGSRYEVAYASQDETAVFNSSGRIEETRFTSEPVSGGGGGSAPAAPTYVSSFGSAGAGNGQFAHPAGIAVGAGGSLWVVDENHYRVQKFNEAGEYQSSFGSQGSENGKFSRPTDVAVAPSGNLWVTDAANNRLEEFNEKGEFLAKVGSFGSGNLQFSGPEALAIDAQGNIWVGDTYNHRVQELNEKGEFIRAFGTNGSGQGQIVESTGIAVGPNGNVWVADWGNNRVEEFSETGSFIRQFGSSGTGAGQFKHPDVIDIDTRGDVWVGDQENSRIQEFNQSGEFLTQLGAAGSGQGQFSFSWPMGIASDSKGRLWISDTGNNRVQRWQIPEYAASAYNPSPVLKYTYSGSTLSKMVLDEPAPLPDPSLAVTVENGLTTSVSSETAGTAAFKYETGKATAATDAEGETKYSYDTSGRLKRVELPNGTWAEVTYDSTSRATAVTVDPAGPEEAKTTHFWYGEQPRETRVWGGGHPEVVYSIGEDGSVFKWTYAEAAPAINSISGSLWANRNTTTPVENKAQTLTVIASSPSLEIGQIQVLINGGAVAAETTCEDPSEPPKHNCEQVKLEWATEPAAYPPGELDLEVVAFDFQGHATSERFFVTIPQQEATGEEEPLAPTFEAIKEFRKEFGVDLDLGGNEAAINERALTLLYQLAREEPVAVESTQEWGVPLRAVDIEALEARSAYVAQAGEVIPAFGAAHPSTYAGYYVDEAQGGVIHVGFTSEAESRLAELRAQLSAPAEKVVAFESAPSRSLGSLEELQAKIASEAESDPALESLTSIAVDPAGNKVVIGTDNPGAVAPIAESRYGAAAAVEGTPPPLLVPAKYSRRNKSGPIQAGDDLEGYGASGGYFRCTAAFGASNSTTGNQGQQVKHHYLLTAGHCFGLGKAVTQASGTTIGHVKKDQYSETKAFTLDGEAVMLEGEAHVPEYIFKSPYTQQRIGKPMVPYDHEEVCQSGVTSGLKCGHVLNEGKPMVIYSRSEAGAKLGNWVVPIMVKVSRGDSGGPIFDRKTGRAIGLTVAAANGSTDPTSPLYGIRPCKTWKEANGEEQYNCPVIGVQPLKPVGSSKTGEARGILPTLGLTFDRG
jgi:YD repeat-containing protein